MKRTLFLLNFFVLLSFSAICQDLHLSLKECIAYADANNLSTQSTELSIATSNIQLSQSRRLMTPTVSASVNQNFGYAHSSTNGGLNLSGRYGINADMVVFNGLNTYNTIKQNKLQVTQAELQVEQNKNKIRIQVIESYLTILMNQELRTYRQDVLTASKEQLTEGAQQYRVGQILESDYLMLKAQYVSDSIAIENANITISNELVILKNLLSIPAQQTISIVTPDSVSLSQLMSLPELESITRQAFEYLPELKMVNNSVEIANFDTKIAKSSYYPTLSVSAGISTGYNNIYSNTLGNSGTGLIDNLCEDIGINLSVPIYQQSKTRNNVKMKELNKKQAELELKQTELSLLKEIESKYLNMKKSYNDYSLTEIQKEAYYNNYLTYLQKFHYGAITTVDLLQQQTSYSNILNNYMQNKYSFLLQKKILDVYTGKNIEL